jgi:hypothetical protein
MDEAKTNTRTVEAANLAVHSTAPAHTAFNLQKAIGVHLPSGRRAYAGRCRVVLGAHGGRQRVIYPENGVIVCAMLAVTMFTAALLVDRFRSTSYAQIASALALAAKAWPTR